MLLLLASQSLALPILLISIPTIQTTLAAIGPGIGSLAGISSAIGLYKTSQRPNKSQALCKLAKKLNDFSEKQVTTNINDDTLFDNDKFLVKKMT